jgi:hypothetical protein
MSLQKNYLHTKQLLEQTIRSILEEADNGDDILKTIRRAFEDPNDDTIAAASEALLSSGLPRANCDDILYKIAKSAKTPEAGEVVAKQIQTILDDPENWSRFTKTAPKQKTPYV